MKYDLVSEIKKMGADYNLRTGLSIDKLTKVNEKLIEELNDSHMIPPLRPSKVQSHCSLRLTSSEGNDYWLQYLDTSIRLTGQNCNIRIVTYPTDQYICEFYVIFKIDNDIIYVEADRHDEHNRGRSIVKIKVYTDVVGFEHLELRDAITQLKPDFSTTLLLAFRDIQVKKESLSDELNQYVDYEVNENQIISFPKSATFIDIIQSLARRVYNEYIKNIENFTEPTKKNK